MSGFERNSDPGREAAATKDVAHGLCLAISRHGKGVIEEPERLRAMLGDYAADRRELHLIMTALEEGVPSRLLNSDTGIPAEVNRRRLVRRLADNRALHESAALWAVQTWATALGLPVGPTGSSSRNVSDEPSRAEQPSGGLVCPFCGTATRTQSCDRCGRDTAAHRRLCPSCGKMAPASDASCWSCGRPFRSDLWWKVPLIIGLFVVAFVVVVLIQAI